MLEWVDLDPLEGLHAEVSLFWTGGLSSTFRLIELIRSGVDVQPIYLAAVIDLRRSRSQELAAMASLTALLRERYPQGGQLRELMIVEKIPDNAWVAQQASVLGYGPSRRAAMAAQWVALCGFAEAHHVPIEVGTTRGDRLAALLRGSVDGDGGSCSVDPARLQTVQQDAQMIFHRLRFPLLQHTRADLVRQARMLRVTDVLAQTWSCWFPSAAHPCQRCPMCRRRLAVLSASFPS